MKSPLYDSRLLRACLEWYRFVPGHDIGTELNKVANEMQAMQSAPDLPVVACLCGSTRFYDAFQQANFDLTMAGAIVLSVGFYPHGGVEKTEHGQNLGITDEEKRKLDDLHKRKIDLADEILVLNEEGYIGSSTRSEVDYALRIGKRVRWLHPDQVPEEHRTEPPRVGPFDDLDDNGGDRN